MIRCAQWIQILIMGCALATPLTAAVPDSIIDLQPFRTTSSIKIQRNSGKVGNATLINLNPQNNSWYLLRLNRGDGASEEVFHLENGNPRTQSLLLQESYPEGLTIIHGNEKSLCDLWGAGRSEAFTQARKSAVPHAPLCGGQVYLRNTTKGHQSPVEAATDFLRNEVPGGEQVVAFVRDTFYAYLYQTKAGQKLETNQGALQSAALSGPIRAALDPARANQIVKAPDLAIELNESIPNGMTPGCWYAASGNNGVYVSVLVPGWTAPELLKSYRQSVNDLSKVESEQVVYLTAFDLGRFDLHYALGTMHPGVGWSGHIQSRMKDASLAGPDGIGTSAPLIRTGLIHPVDAQRTIASFCGGFKRYHGAFKYGPLAEQNHGSHYGFIQEGVLFSSLQPELATIYVLNDGHAGMKTWSSQDNNLLPGIRYARQNGVPIIDGIDPASHMSVPGRFVNRWGPGNWSGSADEKLQTMRAAAALQESKRGRFLMYAFFWSATPSVMARVFQAYHCTYAMLLDMNALVHTYAAVYKREGTALHVQHLIRRMNESDIKADGRYIPRFLGFADDRDFFYLTRKESP